MNNGAGRLSERPRLVAALILSAIAIFVLGIFVGGAGGSEEPAPESPSVTDSAEYQSLEDELSEAKEASAALGQRIEALREKKGGSQGRKGDKGDGGGPKKDGGGNGGRKNNGGGGK